jgi:hypothetical protein
LLKLQVVGAGMIAGYSTRKCPIAAGDSYSVPGRKSLGLLTPKKSLKIVLRQV